MRSAESEEKTRTLLRRKALVSISAAILTAIISGMVLYNILFVGGMVEEKGLIGIFLAAMFSHLTVIGRDLFTPAFIALMKHYHPALLGISAGVGGAIGEVTAYYWGLGIREALQENSKENTISKWIDKYGLLVVLLVAASPLPDAPVALLAGSARFSLKKFLLVEAFGKSLYYSIGASIGGYIFKILSTSMDEWMLSLIVISASIIICIVASWGRSREKVIRIFKRILPAHQLQARQKGNKGFFHLPIPISFEKEC